MWCDAMLLSWWSQTFQKNAVPSSSMVKESNCWHNPLHPAMEVFKIWSSDSSVQVSGMLHCAVGQQVVPEIPRIIVPSSSDCWSLNCRRQQQSHYHLLKELATEAYVGRGQNVAFKVSLSLTMTQFDPEDKGNTVFQNVTRLEINRMEKGCYPPTEIFYNT